MKKNTKKQVSKKTKRTRLKDIFTPVVIFRISLIVILISLLSFTFGRELIVNGEGSLQSFVIVHFAGYLFFFLLPVEALIPYYFVLGYSPLALYGLALITAICAQLIDYGIGRLAPKDLTMHVVGERRYLRVQNFVEKYGGLIIFFFNLFPLSSPVVATVSGVLQYKLWKTVLYGAAGLVVKYFVILMILKMLF